MFGLFRFALCFPKIRCAQPSAISPLRLLVSGVNSGMDVDENRNFAVCRSGSTQPDD